jgi:hypothetical protein
VLQQKWSPGQVEARLGLSARPVRVRPGGRQNSRRSPLWGSLALGRAFGAYAFASMDADLSVFLRVLGSHFCFHPTQSSLDDRR